MLVAIFRIDLISSLAICRFVCDSDSAALSSPPSGVAALVAAESCGFTFSGSQDYHVGVGEIIES